jgi:hypothetical protein
VKSRQALAVMAQARVALIVTELDEIGRFDWRAQLRCQQPRVLGRAVERQKVIDIGL